MTGASETRYRLPIQGEIPMSNWEMSNRLSSAERQGSNSNKHGAIGMTLHLFNSITEIFI
ncbi:MAG: hypothetical protein PUP92_31005 [Rhizonema sp. PD38]|nr:hypothetical protein [Rhizonema sp. PD38]